MRARRPAGLLSLAVVIAVVGYAGGAGACKCDTSPPFLDQAGLDLVAIVTVQTLLLDRHQMVVTIDKVLAGKESRREVTILGGDGGNCYVGLKQFPPSTRLVLALSSMGRAYALSHCGTHYLRVDGDRARGRIDEPDGPDRSISLPTLEARIRSARH